MPKYEFCIAVADETDTPPSAQYPNGYPCKKEGDVIAVRPHPWDWGFKEIGGHLIVIIECDETFAELKEKFECSYYSGGVSRKVLKEEVLAGIRNTMPRPILARRYKIPLDDLKKELTELDLVKVRNKTIRYQPFKSKTQLVRKFTGREGNRKLREKDVDCGVDSKNEKEIKWKSNTKVIKDKSDDSYLDLKASTGVMVG